MSLLSFIAGVVATVLAFLGLLAIAILRLNSKRSGKEYVEAHR